MDILQHIRSFIFGMEDGLVSMLGLVIGVAVGSHDSTAVLLAGAAGSFSAALSMAAGEYLSSKSKREVQESEAASVEECVNKNVNKAIRELKRHYKKVGFKTEDVNQIVAIIHKRPEVLKHKILEIRGITEESYEQAEANALTMFFSFIVAACFPILPFAFFPIDQGQSISIAITALMLFAVGAAKSQATKKSWITSGLEMLIIGGIAGAAGYLIGGRFA